MIYGTGTDIVDIMRIETLIEKSGEKFLNRVFTKNEIEKSKCKSSYYAKRFAAKEAISKALGTGIGSFIQFIDIEILNNDIGRPYVVVNDILNEKILKLIGHYNIHISMSDEKKYATAFAVVEKIGEC
jgi:holo-[acyl-carrier protein] synthase